MGYVVVHYSEIGLKKGNREYFERLLVRNIQKKLGVLAERVNRKYGYLLVETNSLDGRILRASPAAGITPTLCVIWLSPCYLLEKLKLLAF
jgi:adenylyl- and sulfurtransferase ThiI